MLLAKLQEDLTVSLKAKDSETVTTLRLIISDIKNAQIDQGSELSDEEIIKLMKKSVKKLKEANEMFEQGGRDDIINENNAQIAVIEKYLPAEMSDENLSKAIDSVISENQELFDSKPQALIGIAMKKLSSDADPQRIMAELKKRM